MDSYFSEKPPEDRQTSEAAARLKKAKSIIDDPAVRAKWDVAKRLINPQELVGYARVQDETGHYRNVGVSQLKPLSRAFFKLVELCVNFGLPGNWDRPIETLHLAEGPGGFIQAWNWLRMGLGQCDKITGITLIERTDDAVPGWDRSSEQLRHNPNVQVVTGETGNGDITLTENIRYLKRLQTETRPLLVTADGGFDVSQNQNNQESDMFLLILSQSIIALETLGPGGAFILKVFDIFTQPMMDLLQILKGSFHQVKIEKPQTSRPANSEKQIICKEFVDKPPERQMARLHAVREQLVGHPSMYCQRLLTEDLPPTQTSNQATLVSEFVDQQIDTLQRTSVLSQQLGSPLVDCRELVRSKQEEQRRLSIEWCRRQKVPLNAEQIERHPQAYRASAAAGGGAADVDEAGFTTVHQRRFKR